MDGKNGIGRSCALTAFRRQTLSASDSCCCENPHLISGKSPSHPWKCSSFVVRYSSSSSTCPILEKECSQQGCVSFYPAVLCCTPWSQSCLTLAFESPVSVAFSAFRGFEDFPGKADSLLVQGEVYLVSSLIRIIETPNVKLLICWL